MWIMSMQTYVLQSDLELMWIIIKLNVDYILTIRTYVHYEQTCITNRSSVKVDYKVTVDYQQS
jgi:hypothetical protein